MRFLNFIAVLSLVTFVFLLLPNQVNAQVIINEIMADPAATSDKSEWIELYNYSDQDIDLRGWSLDGKAINATDSITIAKKGFYIFTKTAADFKTEFGNISNLFELGISLTNSGKTLELTNGQGYKDTLTYSTASPSISWERKGLTCADLVKHPTAHSANAVNVAYATGCPGSEPPPTPVPELPKLQISEVFPSPQTDKQESEWVELYNWGDKAVDLTGWTLADKSSSSKLDGLIISPHQYLVLSNLTISLNNSGDELSLVDAQKQIVDALSYGSIEKSFAAMRNWADTKYTSDLQATARPTPALQNIYQAEPEVVTVTEQVEVQVPVYVEKVVTVEVPAANEVLGANYELPSTEVHVLPVRPVESKYTLQIWPVFLAVLVISGICLFSDRLVYGNISRMISRVRVGFSQLSNSLSHRFPVLDQWKSRLRAYALGQST